MVVTTQQDEADAEEPQQLHFEVDAGLLIQLGEQLVARRSVALAELIKNAYDADATAVTILLDEVADEHGIAIVEDTVADEHGTIIVEDNGTGMTFEQVRQHWMRIATDDKIRNPLSPVYGRPRTGAKGIGRFAARRLAEKLSVHSVALTNNGTKERVTVTIDWKKFKSGQPLKDVGIDYDKVAVNAETPTGVTLLLEDVRDKWTKDDITDLQRDILTLVNPFPGREHTTPPSNADRVNDPGFSVNLEIPEYPDYEGALGDQFLAGAWAALTGRIDDTGSPQYDLTIRDPQESPSFSPTGTTFPDLLGAYFEVHYFVYRSSYFEDLDYGVREAQKMGREQGGIRVYMDGFRVFPYGDPGDDWLQLDMLKAGRTRQLREITQSLGAIAESVPGRPYLLMPGNNQVFGAVEISHLKHPGIGINVSRERLLESETLDDLRRFIQLGIYWMTVNYARVKAAEEEAGKRGRAGLPSALRLIAQAIDRVQNLPGVEPEVVRELSQVLNYAYQRAKTEREDFISELSMYRVLSSLGATIAMFSHLIRTIVGGIQAVDTELRDLAPHVSPEGTADYRRLTGQLGNWRHLLESQVDLFGSLLGQTKRKKRTRAPLKLAVQRAVRPLALYMKEYGITFSNQIAKGLRTPPIYEAELYAILLHIITNALKAVRGQPVRRIEARAERGPAALHIYLLDTGVGVEPERRKQVFNAFETSSVPDPILGEGTGLGLKAVADIVDTYGGSVQFIEPDQLSSADRVWRTCIEIVIPTSRSH